MTVTIDDGEWRQFVHLVCLGRDVVNGYRDPQELLQEYDNLAEKLLWQCAAARGDVAVGAEDRLREHEADEMEELINAYWLGAAESIAAFWAAVRQHPREKAARYIAEDEFLAEISRRDFESCVRLLFGQEEAGG